VLDGKENGTFIEIGANQPIYINNTYLLESKFGWRGISIDMDSEFKTAFSNYKRTSRFILNNALDVDYEKEFILSNFPKQIDYLSLDIEPSIQTLNCLKKLPLDNYRFNVITYETDFYDQSIGKAQAESIRAESREILLSKGYTLINGNVSDLLDSYPFEDWYVDSTSIDPQIINRFKRASDEPLAAHKYMLDGF
jgi:hypothetical protein